MRERGRGRTGFAPTDNGATHRLYGSCTNLYCHSIGQTTSGGALTADDVVATFKRIPNVPNSPASFAIYTRPVKEAIAVDALTLRLKTERPHPLLPNDLVAVRIIPKKVAESAKTEDFNSGKAVIGTGPYKFAEHVAGDRIVMVANERYAGPKPAFAKVRFKMITNSAARVAALLAGDVQMIEAVPTADIAQLSKDARVALASIVSNRIIYLHMNGGPSQLDTWDYKPELARRDGKDLEGFDKNTGFFTEQVGPLMKSPFIISIKSAFPVFSAGVSGMSCRRRISSPASWASSPTRRSGWSRRAGGTSTATGPR